MRLWTGNRSRKKFHIKSAVYSRLRRASLQSLVNRCSQATALRCEGAYRTFNKLRYMRSVHRTTIVDNKRLDAALLMVAEMQEGLELKRSQRAPRRTGQSDHILVVPDGSVGDGYVKRDSKLGRRADFMK